MYFWSPSTSGFYVTGVNDEAMPTDAVELTADEYAKLQGGQSSEKMIATGEEGTPVLVDRPPATPEQVLARNKAYRNMLLTSAALAVAPLQDAVDLGDATAAEATALTAWKQYRVDVNRIDLAQASPMWPVQPSS